MSEDDLTVKLLLLAQFRKGVGCGSVAAFVHRRGFDRQQT